jgi:hypothetical protein
MVTMDDGTPAGAPAGSEGGIVVWRAIARGAIVALALLVALSVAEAIVDRNVTDFNDTGWIYPFFVGVLASYAIGGWVAGRTAPDGALTNGALAGLFGFVLWIPVRIVIWAVRDEHKGLFSGHAPVVRPGQVFGHLLIAAALGMLGGWIGARVQRRSTASRAGTAS